MDNATMKLGSTSNLCMLNIWDWLNSPIHYTCITHRAVFYIGTPWLAWLTMRLTLNIQSGKKGKKNNIKFCPSHLYFKIINVILKNRLAHTFRLTRRWMARGAENQTRRDCHCDGNLHTLASFHIFWLGVQCTCSVWATLFVVHYNFILSTDLWGC